MQLIKFIGFCILLVQVCHAQTNQFRPHRLTVSIDSFCYIDSRLHGIIEEFFPDNTPEVVSKKLTDKVSNYIQSVAVEHGFKYVANYSEEEKRETDLEIKLELVYEPYRWSHLGKFREEMAVLNLYHVLGEGRFTFGGVAKAFKQANQQRISYEAYFDRAKHHIYRYFRILYNPANKVNEFSYRHSEKFAGMNNWITAEAGIDSAMVKEITLAIDQAILQRIYKEEKYSDTPYVSWSGNFRKPEQHQKSLDYIFSAHISRYNDLLDLRYEWRDAKTQRVFQYDQILITEERIRKGNYIEIVIDSYDLLPNLDLVKP